MKAGKSIKKTYAVVCKIIRFACFMVTAGVFMLFCGCSGSDDVNPRQKDLYEKFLRNEVEVEGETYSQIFSFMIDDFGADPEAYYFDVDEDGFDELLISTYYYGYWIYDIRDRNLVLLDRGNGTAEACGVYQGNDHVYVGHSDFSHVGRQMLSLVRYDAHGKIVENVEINAEYWDSDVDRYDENSEFTYNGQRITMQEYENYMDQYSPADELLQSVQKE